MDVTVPEPAIWFFRSDTKSKSKLGGLPNLPPTLSWPRRRYSVALIASGLVNTGKCTDNVEARKLAETLEEKCNKDISGALLPPLHFIGQIDLSELPELPLEPGGPTLPKSGGLFFFANIQLDAVDSEYFPDHWMEIEYDLSCDTRVLYTDAFGPKREAPVGLPAIADPNEPFSMIEDPRATRPGARAKLQFH